MISESPPDDGAPGAEDPDELRTDIVAGLRRRILVVDDNEDQAESLGMLMKMLGHETELAYDGPGAVDAANAFHPEIALIDIGIPGFDGYEVARRIRQNPRLQGMVLVAQTGWGHADDRARSRAAGFDHHLTKPLEIAELQRILVAARTSAPPPRASRTD